MIARVDTPFFVLLQDDDWLEPDFTKRVIEQFHNTPLAAAIGTNAYPIDGRGERISEELWFSSGKAVETFDNRRDFTLKYLSLDLGRAAPFSNYAYNLNVLKNPALDWKKGRNYCDAVFLAGILRFGPIVWINEPLASVRVHDANISTDRQDNPGS